MTSLVNPHYFKPDTVGDRCIYCGKSEMERPHVAVPSAWKPVIATLATNRIGFRPSEISKYTRFDRQPLIGGNVVRVLLSIGYIERVGPQGRGRETALCKLTVRGWAWVDEGLTKHRPESRDEAIEPPITGSP